MRYVDALRHLIHSGTNSDYVHIVYTRYVFNVIRM